MKNGVINIYKEKGYTSFDVVAKLRGILHQRKIGHTGTLDPDAEGVLPVCVGKATGLVELLTDETKTYEAVLLLGKDTDTQDISGEVLSEHAVTCDEEDLENCLKSFEGAQMQIPPMYSALKVNGKKLYELAREGKTVERKARPVHFYEIHLLSCNLPRAVIRVTCSKGTYIRTLCHDIGERLGCGGCMEALTRVRVGQFHIEDSLRLSEVARLTGEGKWNDILIPVYRLFDYPLVRTSAGTDRLAHNGNRIPEEGYRVIQDRDLVSEDGVRVIEDGSRVSEDGHYVIQDRVGNTEDGVHAADDRDGDPETGFQVERATGQSAEEKRRVRLFDSEGVFIGIYESATPGGLLKPVRMFYDPDDECRVKI